MVIVCGWCGKPTEMWETTALRPVGECRACGHEDPGLPWRQRGRDVPEVSQKPGRPTISPREVSRRLAEARSALGPGATAAELAEHLEVSVRTLGRWRKMSE